ncbi:efflux transporter outer membrane subunit [Tanticharoenia sakaeratensis]|uniref:Outer membrane channel lipoprotein n=1 Tax=Tanticharoenia sakaeratensis NBRC 103193 TaxID=1231623 RepID=A0A0D6MPZ6_9PROT|nr:efflux transporter outer membrane subunit [Tanticharoenia sakaeratensis]GAN55762.1 outer membrane channel lipoprotein [Tanticharoenia sakaeratensis NBRC 103193]GBQ18570.1 outer membrane channel lipoprotein [Tanticharoenia sakaeratensis NBRC 103193]
MRNLAFLAPRACAPLLAFALTQCAVGPDFHKPTVLATMGYQAGGVPQHTTPSNAGAAGALQQISSDYDLPGDWWTLFHCRALNQLVTLALANNPSLKSAEESLRAATEQKRSQAGQFYPQINGFFNPTRNKTSIALSPVPGSNGYLYNLHTAQLNISYMPDIWGGIRRQHEALAAQQEVQRFQLEATYLTLTTNLVVTAIQYATIRAQLAATSDIIASQQHLLTTLNGEKTLGEAGVHDVVSQQALLAQAQATLAPLHLQLDQARDQLAALAGLAPNATLPDFSLDDFVLPPTLPATLPSRLIEQRPDVRAAQAVMHDASAQVGVAIANRLPNVQLQAMPSIVVNNMDQFFTPGYGMWTLGAMITQPLFEGGQLLHLERASRHLFEQAVQQYHATVLTAVQNVADCLHATTDDSQALVANANAARVTAESLRIARAQQRLGDISQVMVLNAQQADAQARLALIAAQGARFTDTVALFQAVGGGWWHRDDTPPAPGH